MIQQLFDIWLYGLIPAFAILVSFAGYAAYCGSSPSTGKLIFSTIIWPWVALDCTISVIISIIGEMFKYRRNIK